MDCLVSKGERVALPALGLEVAAQELGPRLVLQDRNEVHLEAGTGGWRRSGHLYEPAAGCAAAE